MTEGPGGPAPRRPPRSSEGGRGDARSGGRRPAADGPVDPIPVDVGRIVQRTVASLYSHLVTRPTGRAVRLAIERQVVEARTRALSLVDLSEVRILDFSCADEVVAKLLLRFASRSEPDEEGERGEWDEECDGDEDPDAFFVFRGVGDVHRGPIDAVLERQSLLAVGETDEGRFELLGTATEAELRVWSLVESLGRLSTMDLPRHLPDPSERDVLRALARRRVVLELTEAEEFRALSTLVPPLETTR